MKKYASLLLLSLLINLSLSKGLKNQSHLSKNHGKKNNTHRTFLIRTELNITEIEKLLNRNQTLSNNSTLISEIDDENENYPELDIEIEDEIEDNSTRPELIDYKVKNTKTSETKAFLAMNDEKYVKQGKFGKFLLLISLIIFICAMIYFNNLKKNKKVVRTYKLFDFDIKEEKLIMKNE